MAETLLERRLVARVSLLPQRSLYRWRGHLERESEVQMLLKTSAAGLELLRETVMDLHSYDTRMAELARGRCTGLWRVGSGGTQLRWVAASVCRETWERAPSWVTICPAQSAPSSPQRCRLSPWV